MTISQEALAHAIQPIDGRVPTLREIGELFGVTGERVRQKLVKYHITKPYSNAAPKCQGCGESLCRTSKFRQKQVGLCYSCAPGHITQYVRVPCSNCGTKFRLSLAELRARLSPYAQNHPTHAGKLRQGLYCSYRCVGQVAGRKYGFAAHPENTRAGGGRRRKYPGEGTPYQRRKRAGVCARCATPALPNRVHCAGHLDRQRALERQRRLRNRLTPTDGGDTMGIVC